MKRKFRKRNYRKADEYRKKSYAELAPAVAELNKLYNIVYNYNDTINNDSENKTSAFDNNAYQPNTKTTNNTTSNQETTSNSNQESNNSQTQTINNTQNQDLSRNESMTTTNKGTETLTRKGNIGVTTTQQMVMQEVELRKHNLIDIMFNDIDSILTINLY